MNSKTLSPELVKELETLVNSNIDMSLFPYVKGKSIRIKHIIIRETNFGFLVFDTKNNKIFFLETNTQPGLTPISLLPEQANYKGLSFSEIIFILIKNLNY